MPKVKSHSGAKKRFSLTGTGLVKRGHNYKGHLLTKKTRKRKRRLRTTSYVSPSETKMIKKLIPYK